MDSGKNETSLARRPPVSPSSCLTSLLSHPPLLFLLFLLLLLCLLILFILLYFGTGSHYGALPGLKLARQTIKLGSNSVIHLLLPPRGSD